MSTHEDFDLGVVEVKQVTAKALLVKVDDSDVWIPKSQILDCDKDVDDVEIGDVVEIIIPQWLAEEKGLD
jgi:hypothetical protein